MLKGIVSLPVILTNSNHNIVYLVDFLIVHRENAYNYIVSRP